MPLLWVALCSPPVGSAKCRCGWWRQYHSATTLRQQTCQGPFQVWANHDPAKIWPGVFFGHVFIVPLKITQKVVVETRTKPGLNQGLNQTGLNWVKTRSKVANLYCKLGQWFSNCGAGTISGTWGFNEWWFSIYTWFRPGIVLDGLVRVWALY